MSINNIPNTKLLASLVVFRELYDNEHDVCDAISKFLSYIIHSESLHNFSLKSITVKLNQTYDFNLPATVVKTALKRLDYIKLEHGYYSTTEKLIPNIYDIDQKRQKIQEDNNDIITELFVYIEKEKNVSLNDKEKEEVVDSFCTFVLDNTLDNKYTEYISGLIITNKNNEDFNKKLNTIREGVVLYIGIKYTNDINEIGAWKSDLIIYLDTEILFHCVGYNGSVYEEIFNEFYQYVKEINQKKASRIKLKYFTEVKDEVERFFRAALESPEGKITFKSSSPAMISILNGCKNKSDIITKKVAFYKYLKDKVIIEDDYNNYFDKSNHEYIIFDEEYENKILNNLKLKEIHDILDFLNYINIHRRNSLKNGFENIKCIFLTGNSKTLSITWYEKNKIHRAVPLATHLSFLTNKFWFKLNKGFGKNKFPKSFEIITKAQIVLSSLLNESVSNKFEDLITLVKKGELSEEEIKGTYIELRKLNKKPEDIDEEKVPTILDTLKQNNIERFIKEQELIKRKAEEESQKNVIKAKQESQKNVILKRDLSTVKKELKETIKESIKTNEHLLESIKNLQSTYENTSRKINSIVSKSCIYMKCKLMLIIATMIIIPMLLMWKYGWNYTEPILFILFLIIGVIPYIYMIITEDSFNPLKIYETKKCKIKKELYIKEEFDDTLLEKVQEDINKIEEEISQLQNKDIFSG